MTEIEAPRTLLLRHADNNEWVAEDADAMGIGDTPLEALTCLLELTGLHTSAQKCEACKRLPPSDTHNLCVDCYAALAALVVDGEARDGL